MKVFWTCFINIRYAKSSSQKMSVIGGVDVVFQHNSAASTQTQLIYMVCNTFTYSFEGQEDFNIFD